MVSLYDHNPGSKCTSAEKGLENSGEHYSPHVTIGVGTVDYLNALVSAPFPTFTFSAVGVTIYQSGNFGTAAKLLRSFKLMQ
jgi:hypothetical protein